MNGWIKHFADSTKVIGDDLSVQRKEVSWRKSKSEGMLAAEIQHDGTSCIIYGPGPFWQSDGYESCFPGFETKLVKRRVEIQIQSSDKHLRFEFRPNQSSYAIAVDGGALSGSIMEVPSHWHGKWLVLEYDVSSRNVKYYVSENKI